MSRTQHTPGPWFTDRNTADYYDIRIGANVFDQAIAGVHPNIHIPCSVEEAGANARLMAAAPDLLAAAKQAERFLDSLSNSYEVCEHTQALIDTVKAAIAKAEGR